MSVNDRSPSFKVDPEDQKELLLLDKAIIALRMAFLNGDLPEAINSDDDAETIFRNLCAMQVDYARAIRRLTVDGHILAAASILRTVLEVTTSFAWATEKFSTRKKHYLDLVPFGGIKNMMDELGWVNCYEQLYRPLCAFTHASYSVAEIQKELVSLDKIDNSNLDAVLAYTVHLSSDENVSKVFAEVEKAPEAMLKEYGPLFSAHIFDFVIVMLMRGCGSYADSNAFFPKREFMDEWDDYAVNFHKNMPIIWYEEKKRLSVYKVNKWFSVDPNLTP